MAKGELTITEALAEIKTIGKRIAKKQESILPYIARPEGMKDPLERDGGSVDFIQRERQGIVDLEQRIVDLRARIAKANVKTHVTIEGTERTIADWLTWRREIAPARQRLLATLRNGVTQARAQAQQRGFGVVSAVAQIGEVKPTDMLINVSEIELEKELEELQTIMGALDGQLSLKNATTMI